MPSQMNPYLSFRDNAAEAGKIMHSSLTTDKGFVLMASDTPDSMNLDEGSSYSISLSGNDGDELRGYWDKLLDGGQMTMPLERAPWGDMFGMLTDRFGTSWMISIEDGGS